MLLQKDLTALKKWKGTWQMIIRIAPRCRKIIDTTYSLHGHTLEVVDASKYLGVTITESPTWEKHIGNITNKASRTLGFIRRNLRECAPHVKEAS